VDISHVCVCVCVWGGGCPSSFLFGVLVSFFFSFLFFLLSIFFFGAQIFLKSSVTLLPHLTLSFHSFSFLFGIKAFLLMSSSSSFFFLLRGEKKKKKRKKKKRTSTAPPYLFLQVYCPHMVGYNMILGPGHVAVILGQYSSGARSFLARTERINF